MFVVTMHKTLGNKHSYVLGVFYTYEQAKLNANTEMLLRAGKYDAYLDFCAPGCTYRDAHSIDPSLLGWMQYEYSEGVMKEAYKIYPENNWS